MIIDAVNSAMATDISKDIYQINVRDEVIDELDKLLGITFDKRYVRKESLTGYNYKVLNSVYTTA